MKHQAAFLVCLSCVSALLTACSLAETDQEGNGQVAAPLEPNDGADQDPCAGVEDLGSYVGSFCGSGPFILTEDISCQDSLENCALNASLNPSESVQCTFNDVVIFTSEATPGACEDGGPPPTDSVCVGDLVPAAFDFPVDDASCSGAQYVRFVPEQGLWLGLVSCGDGSARFYLARSAEGPFYQATDLAGHGQDHCELVRDGFSLPSEDEVTTGCVECSTGPNLPLEYVAAYARAFAGEPFEFVPQTGEWSNQVSRIDCGCGL